MCIPSLYRRRSDVVALLWTQWHDLTCHCILYCCSYKYHQPLRAQHTTYYIYKESRVIAINITNIHRYGIIDNWRLGPFDKSNYFQWIKTITEVEDEWSNRVLGACSVCVRSSIILCVCVYAERLQHTSTMTKKRQKETTTTLPTLMIA